MIARRLLLLVLATATAAAVLSVGPYGRLAALCASSGGMLDEAPRATATLLAQHVEAIGASGVELYSAHARWDLAFLLANAVLLSTLIRTLAVGRARWLVLLPWSAAAFDVVENALVQRVLASDRIDDALASTLAAVTTAKMAAFGLASLSIAVAALVRIYRAVLGSRPDASPATIDASCASTVASTSGRA